MADSHAVLPVQVCYAPPGRIFFRELNVAVGTTLREAIVQSGLLLEYPQLDLGQAGVGIFGKIKALNTEARARDRIEVYSQLIADPKESRRRRAEKKAVIKNSKAGRSN